jgi:hypothetical protein
LLPMLVKLMFWKPDITGLPPLPYALKISPDLVMVMLPKNTSPLLNNTESPAVSDDITALSFANVRQGVAGFCACTKVELSFPEVAEK